MTDKAGEFWEEYEAATSPVAKRAVASLMVAELRSLEKEVAALKQENLRVVDEIRGRLEAIVGKAEASLPENLR